MYSHNRDQTIEPLPPTLSSMWRLCKLGYRHEPRLMTGALVLSQIAALPDALLALWLALLGAGVVQHRPGMLKGAAIGLGISAAATWFLRTVSTRFQRRFRDKVTIALEWHVAQLQASISTIAHQERPEYLDRLSMLRNQVFVLDHMYMSLFSTLGWILRLAVTMALLASIHPALLLFAVFAVPTVLTSSCSKPPSSRLRTTPPGRAIPSRYGSLIGPDVTVNPRCRAFGDQKGPARGSASAELSRSQPIEPGAHENASM